MNCMTSDAKVVLEKIGDLIELNLKSPATRVVNNTKSGRSRNNFLFYFYTYRTFLQNHEMITPMTVTCIFCHSEHMSVFESEAFCV